MLLNMILYEQVLHDLHDLKQKKNLKELNLLYASFKYEKISIEKSLDIFVKSARKQCKPYKSYFLIIFVAIKFSNIHSILKIK